MVALQHWWHLLIGTPKLVVILTNHANLQYYRHPQKINQRVARYINFLEDFNYQLKHIPGAHNHANALSHQPDHDNRAGDNDQVVVLPDSIFAHILSTTALDEMIILRQKVNCLQIEKWKTQYPLEEREGCTWYKDRVLVVTGNNEDKRALLEVYHDAPLARHPGVVKTLNP
jgi:hypothetical protein